jgi:serine/threonine protein phosphatase PrpC
MQGWRKRMEDSHISDLGQGSNNNIHIFGVFDGHGGKKKYKKILKKLIKNKKKLIKYIIIGEEVSLFVKKHFTEYINQNKNFKNGNLKEALKENFLKMDELMIEAEGKLELKKYAKVSKEQEELRNQKEKNKQADMFKQLFDPRSQEDCNIALMTGCTANVCIIDENDKRIICSNSGDSRGVLCRNGIAYPLSEDHKPEIESEKIRIYAAEGWVSEGRVKGK